MSILFLTLIAATSIVNPAYFDAVYEYGDDASDWYSQVSPKVLSFKVGTPLEPMVEARSETNFSSALMLQTDADEFSPKQARAHILLVTDRVEDSVQIEVHRFQSIQISFVGESLFIISRQLDEVSGIEEIYDLDKMQWLLQRSVSMVKN